MPGMEGEEETYVGMDLGTTTIAVAYYDRAKGRPELIANLDTGSRTTPSYVALFPGAPAEESVVIGADARSMAVREPAHVLYETKRFFERTASDPLVRASAARMAYNIGVSDIGTVVFGVPFREQEAAAAAELALITPVHVATLFIRFALATAARYLSKSITRMVITVPADFTSIQRDSVKAAAEAAGISRRRVRIINEPSASALLATTAGVEETLAVYDFGGSTFDVTVLQMSADGTSEVLATDGDPFLGGRDFDAALAEAILAQDARLTVDQMTSLSARTRARLRAACEDARHRLSTPSLAQVQVCVESFHPDTGADLIATLTRTRFNAIVAPIIARSVEITRRCIGSHAVGRVLLTGGCVRMPAIQDALRSAGYDVQFIARCDPDETVALGAAEYAWVLWGSRQDNDDGRPRKRLVDVCSLSLGIAGTGSLMNVIIPRGAKLPARRSCYFTTVEDNERVVEINIYEGERKFVYDNFHVGTVEAPVEKPLPRGSPKLEIAFLVDECGLLTIEYTDRNATPVPVDPANPGGPKRRPVHTFRFDHSSILKDTERVKGHLDATRRFAALDARNAALCDAMARHESACRAILATHVTDAEIVALLRRELEWCTSSSARRDPRVTVDFIRDRYARIQKFIAACSLRALATSG